MDNSINSIVKKLRENRILAERKDYSKYSRDELIKLAQDGDQLAMETLINSHQSFLRMFARKYFLASGDQDDLMQVASVGLWQAIMDWDGSGNFEAFAGMYIKRAIAKELDRDSAEKSKIHTDADSMDAPINTSGEDEKTLGDTLPANGVSLEDEILGREGVEDLRNFLKSNFNPKEREVIEKYIEGYKVKEISEVLNMPYKTVDNILYKVKYKLKEYMKNKDVRESTQRTKDIEFSDEEKRVLSYALRKIRESESLDESTRASLEASYENSTEEQLDQELYEIDKELIDMMDRGIYDEDLDTLEDMAQKLSAMEEYLTDAQYKYSEEILQTIWNAEDSLQSTEDPHAAEKIHY